MGPGVHLCRFDNASQNGVSAGMADATNSRCHKAPSVGPHHPTVLATSNPAMGEDDPG